MSPWQTAQLLLIEPEVAFSLAFISTRTTSWLPVELRRTMPRIKSPRIPPFLRGFLSYGDHFPNRRIPKVKGSQDSFRKRWSPAHVQSIGAHNPHNFL